MNLQHITGVQLLQAWPQPAWFQGPDGQQQPNAAWIRQFGPQDGPFDWKLALHPDHHPVVQHHHQQALQLAQPYSLDIGLCTPEGVWQPWQLQVTPIELAPGSVGWLGVATVQAAHSASQPAVKQMLLQSTTLQKVTTRLYQALQPEDIVQAVLEESSQALGACAGTVSLLEDDDMHLRGIAWQGIRPHVVEAWGRFPLQAPLPASEVTREGKARFYTTRQRFQEDYPQLASINAQSSIEAMAFLPIHFAGRTLGALMFGFDRPTVFSPDEQAFMENLTDQLAQALERSRLQRVQQQLIQEKEDTIAHLQAILDHTPIGIGLFDRDLRFQTVNQQLARHNRLPAEAHLHHTLAELFGPEGERVEAMLRQVLHTGQPLLSVEMSEQAQDVPNPREWLINHFPVHGPDGSVMGVGCTVEDITERKQAERALQESQHFLSRITDTTPMMIHLQDVKQGRTIYTNRHMPDVLGYTTAEINAMGDQVGALLLHPDDVQQAMQHRQQRLLLRDGETLDREYRVRHRNGHWRWFYTRETVFSRDAQGRPAVVLGTSLDITKRKQAEQALKESEQRFERIANQAPVMVWMTDADKKSTFYNRAWLDFTGRTLEQELQDPWLGDIHPADREQAMFTCGQAFEIRQEFEMEFRLRRRDGQYRWMLDRGVPRLGPDGHFVGFIGACIDIHDRKVAEEALQQSEQRLRELTEAQKRFVADAAHELRTPLTSIQGNLDLFVRYRDIAEADRQEILSDVQREATRLGRLVNDMLQLARGDAGAILREDEVQLHRIVLEAWRETERVADRHTLQLGDLHNIVLLGDTDRLKQLVLILLENALKYTPEGGTIHLSLEGQAQQALLKIQDTGVGIAPEDLQKVFERFYRVDQSRHRGTDPGGTGLGLPIAKWIVEQHEGQVWLESELGKGTTAFVQLPIRALEP